MPTLPAIADFSSARCMAHRFPNCHEDGKRSQAPAGKRVGNIPKPGCTRRSRPHGGGAGKDMRRSRRRRGAGAPRHLGGCLGAPYRVESRLSARRTPPCFPCFPLHCFRGRAGLMWTPAGRPQPDPPMKRTPPGSDVSRAYASAEVAAGGGEDRHPLRGYKACAKSNEKKNDNKL